MLLAACTCASKMAALPAHGHCSSGTASPALAAAIYKQHGFVIGADPKVLLWKTGLRALVLWPFFLIRAKRRRFSQS